MSLRTVVAAVLMLAFSMPAKAQQDQEFNTLHFQTTFKIEGPGAQTGTVTFGTVFLMSRPIPETTKFQTVLITARHVLEGIRGDTATLNLRRKTTTGWQRIRFPLKIRDS